MRRALLSRTDITYSTVPINTLIYTQDKRLLLCVLSPSLVNSPNNGHRDCKDCGVSGSDYCIWGWLCGADDRKDKCNIIFITLRNFPYERISF